MALRCLLDISITNILTNKLIRFVYNVISKRTITNFLTHERNLFLGLKEAKMWHIGVKISNLQSSNLDET